jgi:hypothetical protein
MPRSIPARRYNEGMDKIAEFVAIFRRCRNEGRDECEALAELQSAMGDFLTLADIKKLYADLSQLDRQLANGIVELARRPDGSLRT